MITMADSPQEPVSREDCYLGNLLGGDDGHSLLGIEWAIYALLSLLGVAGAWSSRFLRRTLLSRGRRSEGA
jgi:hypothetical protein